MRRPLAFLAAPVPAALFQSFVVALWPKEAALGVFKHPASMFVVILIYFYLFGLLIGVPTFLALRRRTSGLIAPMLAGSVAGILPVGLALGVSSSAAWTTAYVVIYDLLFFGLGGAAAGWLYWFVGLRNVSEEGGKKATA
jgi:hypothetical protein